jgi:hypothetical protein
MGTRPSGLYPGILGEPSPVTPKSWRPFRRGGTWFLLAVRSWLQNSCRFQRLRVVEIFLSLLVQIQTHPTPEMDYGILILRGRFLGGSFRESSAGALSTSRVVLFDYWTSSHHTGKLQAVPLDDQRYTVQVMELVCWQLTTFSYDELTTILRTCGVSGGRTVWLGYSLSRTSSHSSTH